MPTILRIGSFKFVIHPRDHAPPHVHAAYNGQEASISIQTGVVLANGFNKTKDLKLAVLTVLKNQELLMQKWEEWHE